MAAESILKVVEIPGRGRALVATRALMAGQEVLRESPILVYSALPLVKHQHHNSSDYCNHCFRIISSQSAMPCPTCSSHHFCNQTCLSAAHLLSHSPLVCQSLCRLRDYLSMQSLERQIQARFLIAAYNLALVSPSDFQLLISLQGCVSDCSADESQFLHTIVSSARPIQIPGLSLSVETASLLAKDKLNAFGLMEPPHNLLHKNGQRSVRAYAVYPTASLFNHDCLPNACRFDYVDSAPNNNTEIVVRMIHDVPQGREICLSYFPVNLNYCSRQKRLLEDYGFACDCDRCKVEANWSDNEDGNEADAGNVDIMEEGEDEDMDEEVEQYSDVEFENEDSAADFPHAYFFARFMCSIENCGGTLAPLPPLGSRVSGALECNACGDIKKDEVINGAP